MNSEMVLFVWIRYFNFKSWRFSRLHEIVCMLHKAYKLHIDCPLNIALLLPVNVVYTRPLEIGRQSWLKSICPIKNNRKPFHLTERALAQMAFVLHSFFLPMILLFSCLFAFFFGTSIILYQHCSPPPLSSHTHSSANAMYSPRSFSPL